MSGEQQIFNTQNMRNGRVLPDKLRYRYTCSACNKKTDWFNDDISSQLVYSLDENTDINTLSAEQIVLLLQNAAVKTDPNVYMIKKSMDTDVLKGAFFDWMESHLNEGKACPSCGAPQAWRNIAGFSTKIGCLAGILFAVGVLAYFIGIWGTAVSPSPTRQLVGEIVFGILGVSAVIIVFAAVIKQSISRRKYKSALPYKGFLEIEWPEPFRKLREDENLFGDSNHTP